MQCPFCQEDRDRVVDSRATDAGRVVRRRRLCQACGKRFTTYEKATDGFRLTVIKRDKSRVPYDREKLSAALEKACYKRPISADTRQHIVEQTEEALYQLFDKEVPSTEIGRLLMRYLRAVDKLAYIRFASIFLDVQDAREFLAEVSQTLERPEPIEQLTLFKES